MPRTAVLATNLSVEEFVVYDIPDGNAELVRGEVRVSPWPSLAHGAVVAEIFERLIIHVRAGQLGQVFTKRRGPNRLSE